jgi:two-component system sensor histidine kinase CpxA
VAVAILEERAGEGQRKYVEGLREEVTQMSELVTELLHFSKQGLIREKPDLVPISVGELVAKVKERESAGADVQFTGDGNLIVMAQAEGLTRALSNLIRNAIRYAGADGPIEIAAQRDGDDVLISVADHGPGLPDDVLDRIFTPFYRPDTSRSRDSGGAGLGLAIVKACVESSGGTVVCRNRAPSGLEITIRLRSADAQKS